MSEHRHVYQQTSDGYDPQYVMGRCDCGDVQVFARRDRDSSPMLSVTVRDESGAVIRRIARAES